MSKTSTVEICFHDSEMIVSPSLHAINRRKSAQQISVEVNAALDEPRERMVTDVIIDLGQVTWISSAGLNELIRLQRRSRASGLGLRLRSLHDTIREVLRMTRLERTFAVDGQVRESITGYEGRERRTDLDSARRASISV